MIFSSTVFLFLFLPVTLAVYYLLAPKHRNGFLALASLFFYAWGEKKLVVLMIFSIVVNYLGGLLIGYFRARQMKRRSKGVLLVFLAVNILLLVYFKYANFFVDSFNQLGLFAMSSLDEILLPIGISFFTFQGMSYLIDAYYGRIQPQRSLIAMGLYISMFPQLIAGPIVRYIDIEKQISSKRLFSKPLFASGVRRFIIGFFKKVVIANPMGHMADIVFDHPDALGTSSYWIGVVCYAFQIYFDFSGYSDMAIGLGKMFGFTFLENFNLPYISRSIQEFWRRWHISLSTWFRDYLYIPLGGNRRGNARTYLNLFIVFFVTGLWHGASWNFIIWGLYHGLFLILERVGFATILNRLPRVLQHMYSLLVVLLGWVLFRAIDLRAALEYLQRMFVWRSGGNEVVFQYLSPYLLAIALLAIFLSTDLRRRIPRFVEQRVPFFSRTFASQIFYIGLFAYSLMELASSSYNPFIYFRF